MKNAIVKIQRGAVEVHIDDNGYGIIDIDAKWAFTRGQCHALAAAIKEKTKWTVIGLGDDHDSPAHCVVEAPKELFGERRYLDIDGFHTIADLRKEMYWNVMFGGTNELIVNKDIPLEELLRPFYGYVKPNMKAAEPFAKTLLTEANKQLKENGHKPLNI